MPTVYINSTEGRGYLRMLEDDFGLVKSFRDDDEGIRWAIDWLDMLDSFSGEARSAYRAQLEVALPDGVDYIVAQLLNG